MSDPRDGGAEDAGGEGTEGTPAPVRVRVSAAPVVSPVTRGIALPGAPVREAGAVFDRSLVRSQLRLALGCLVGFLLVAGAFTAGVFAVAGLDDPVVLGVPLSWLLQAYGYYPLILFFAVVFARGAGRNERRYRELAGSPEEGATRP